MKFCEHEDKRIKVGRQAIEAVQPYFHARLGRVKSHWKPDRTRVTEADHEISRRIFSTITSVFPKDDLCSEESERQEGGVPLQSQFAWVLDPIDGTNNFALGLPNCGISLALLKDGYPLYGWIYDGARQVLLAGGPGRDVSLGEELLTSEITRSAPPETTYLAVHTPWRANVHTKLSPLLAECKIRALGSSALHLALLAGGVFQAVVDYNVKIWDIAGGLAIGEALGYSFYFFNGNPFPLQNFDVAMPDLHYLGCHPAHGERLCQLIGESAAQAKWILPSGR
ncbi:MAG: inositol monophosphatase family protein [Opitutales bacterium]|nr:inositol monophosphatase family protein [Opitutales bacterium]